MPRVLGVDVETLAKTVSILQAETSVDEVAAFFDLTKDQLYAIAVIAGCDDLNFLTGITFGMAIAHIQIQGKSCDQQ